MIPALDVSDKPVRSSDRNPSGRSIATRLLRRFRGSVSAVLRNRELPKLALLIDADNVNDRSVRQALSRLPSRWDTIYRRAYGTGLIKRAALFRECGVQMVEVIANSPGKNSTDIAIVVDAMAALYSDHFDAIALVSSDGDYTRLATAIREHGTPVYVFGTISAPMALRRACTEFHFLEITECDEDRVQTVLLGERTEFLGFVRSLIVRDGSTTIQSVNNEAIKRYTNFAPRKLGATSLKTLLVKSGHFEISPMRARSGKVTDYLVSVRLPCPETVVAGSGCMSFESGRSSVKSASERPIF